MANIIVDRMMRAAKLDGKLYEEVEADESATGQAVGIVAMSAVAAGIGSGGGGVLGVLVVAAQLFLDGSYGRISPTGSVRESCRDRRRMRTRVSC